MNPKLFHNAYQEFKGLPKRPSKGISAEIEKLEKELRDKKLTKQDLITLKERLLNFYKAWSALSEAMDSPNIEIGDIPCECYPFKESFDDINVCEWVEKFIEQLDAMGI